MSDPLRAEPRRAARGHARGAGTTTRGSTVAPGRTSARGCSTSGPASEPSPSSLRVEGRDVVALEPHAPYAELLEAGVGRRPNVEVVNATVEELAGPRPEPFDSVLCFNVLEHIPDRRLGASRGRARPARARRPSPAARPRAPTPLRRRSTAGSVTCAATRRGRLPTCCARVGLEPSSVRYVNPVGALGWLVTFRLRSPEQLAARADTALFDALVPALQPARPAPAAGRALRLGGRRRPVSPAGREAGGT